MTEYTEMIEKARLEEEVKKWADQIKYIHMNNGVTETKYNNGDIQYVNNKTGKTHWHRAKTTDRSLVVRFQQAMTDFATRLRGSDWDS